MKKTLLLLLSLILSLWVEAGNRTEEQMKESATSALCFGNKRAANAQNLKEYLTLSKLRIYGYDNGGFAVVTSDDRFESVIGISSSHYSNSLPCGFEWWVKTVNANMEASAETLPHKRSNRVANAISPLITTIWGQERPFNDNCTFTNGTKTYQCVTGCVATALAQVMNYYRYPSSGTGSNSYDITYNNDFTITFSEDFSRSVYDWDHMLNSYESYSNSKTTDIYTQAVAKLMKDCGVAINMRYSDSSHGSSSSIIRTEEALKKYFKYDSSTKYYSRSDYTKDEWLDIIYQEIAKGRPIIYAGMSSDKDNASGHAFVLTGYDSSGKVYINWGWDGLYEGYYDIDLLNPGTNRYNYDQRMVVAVPANNVNLHNLNITANGNGSVNYARIDGVEVRQGTQLFKIREDNSVTLYFLPDVGFQLKSVKINNTDITSTIKDNQYIISNVSKDFSVDVEYEEIPGYTSGIYNMFITCVGESLSSTVTSTSSTTNIGFTISNSGKETITITKLVVKDSENNTILFTTSDTKVLGELKGGFSKSLSLRLGQNISSMPVFELEYSYKGEDYAYITNQYKVLSIKVNSYGKISFSGNLIQDNTTRFSIKTGDDVVLDFVPNEGCAIQKLTINNSDETSKISSENRYIINNITQDINANVVFKVAADTEHMIDGHEYVDLGISSGKYWSTVNLGAELPEDAGNYYSDGRDSRVTSTWGENWRTPTKDEFQELIDECEWTWTEKNGKKGYSIKGPNGNTLFLPAAGYHDILGSSNYGKSVNYWTSSTDSYSSNYWALSGVETEVKLSSSFNINDYTIRPIATYIPPTYKLDYIVDGTEFKSYDYKEGTVITPEAEPNKEGHTFSGWSEIPETMPPHDVTITGSFTINSYTLTYMLDGNVYKESQYEYGANILPEPIPEGNYVTFEWIDLPSTMPAHDVVVNANYITGIKELMTEGDQNALIYTLDGKQQRNPQKGINIIKLSNKTKKIFVK